MWLHNLIVHVSGGLQGQTQDLNCSQVKCRYTYGCLHGFGRGISVDTHLDAESQEPMSVNHKHRIAESAVPCGDPEF